MRLAEELRCRYSQGLPVYLNDLNTDYSEGNNKQIIKLTRERCRVRI